MSKIQKSQTGRSALGNVVTLAVAAYAVFIGIQYVPQLMESGTVDGVLDGIQGNYRFGTAPGAGDIESLIEQQLSLNDALDLRDSFKVARSGDSYSVTVSYNRELNLLYARKTLHYEKTLTLD
ncbi:MAG TPA: hypothetical protein VI566_09575 [Xanthomonadales bacterium]|nr:hypothetical protein [Xanthomonadales bacterium]